MKNKIEKIAYKKLIIIYDMKSKKNYFCYLLRLDLSYNKQIRIIITILIVIRILIMMMTIITIMTIIMRIIAVIIDLK